jgi:hypothetical protein
MATDPADTELKARHRNMWALGDYASMVETFLLPVGLRLVEACGIGPGMRSTPSATSGTSARPKTRASSRNTWSS